MAESSDPGNDWFAKAYCAVSVWEAACANLPAAQKELIMRVAMQLPGKLTLRR